MQIRAKDFEENWPDALTASFQVASEAAKQVEAAAKEAGKVKDDIASVKRELLNAKNDLANSLTKAVMAAERAADRSEPSIRSFAAYAILFMFVGGVVGVMIGRAFPY